MRPQSVSKLSLIYTQRQRPESTRGSQVVPRLLCFELQQLIISFGVSSSASHQQLLSVLLSLMEPENCPVNPELIASHLL